MNYLDSFVMSKLKSNVIGDGTSEAIQIKTE